MKKKIIIISGSIVVISVSIILTLFYFGVLHFNNPSKSTYPIRGVDLSCYQGAVGWQVLAEEDIEFAFIKATEGSGYLYPNFSYNWEEAGKTDLKIGAYHFFSYDSSGKTQAENFIKNVPAKKGMLPPVVDIEFYGDKEQNLPSKQEAQSILNELLLNLENHYHIKPIIYATKKSYDLYIKDSYNEYPIWIRDIFTEPSLPDGREWLFWQYSNRHVLKGYSGGDERFIDMNVFNGTKQDFESFLGINKHGNN